MINMANNFNLYLVNETTGEVVLEMPYDDYKWMLVDYVANGGTFDNMWLYFTEEYGLNPQGVYEDIINPVEYRH